MKIQIPLLSICIPTYNRVSSLSLLLQILRKELIGVEDLVEIYVSDNDSQDETNTLVHSYISKIPIVYNKNEKNIGPDRNFLNCFYNAKGKYIWLLGDDDYLQEGILKIILNVLSTVDVGLLHFRKVASSDKVIKYEDPEAFLCDVGHMITFMSANIIRSDIVKKVKVDESLMSSNLLQVAFFIESALSRCTNVILNENAFLPQEVGRAGGGYNFFKVFIVNYLSLWKKYLDDGKISIKTYRKLKKRIYKNFITLHIAKILILKVMPKMETNNAWSILLDYYGKEPYAYFYSLKIIYYCFKLRLFQLYVLYLLFLGWHT